MWFAWRITKAKYRYNLRIFHNYGFSTTKIITRMRLNVTLHVHYRSCFVIPYRFWPKFPHFLKKELLQNINVLPVCAHADSQAVTKIRKFTSHFILAHPHTLKFSEAHSNNLLIIRVSFVRVRSKIDQNNNNKSLRLVSVNPELKKGNFKNGSKFNLSIHDPF